MIEMILLFIVYILIGYITAVIECRLSKSGRFTDFSISIIFAWPFILILMVATLPFFIVNESKVLNKIHNYLIGNKDA